MFTSDLIALSAEEKRALLARLLQDRAVVAAPQPASSPPPTDLADLHPYEAYVNPYLGATLRAVNMDKRYVRGEGCWLTDDKGTRILDFTGAYGALPFGFNPPEICQAVTDVFAAMEPSFIQPSALEAAGELARRLIEIAPGDLRYVTFTNSGAESVEAAIKLARAATGKLGILSTERSFHGKTLGALSATGRALYQQAFGAPAPHFARIPYGSLRALEETLSRHAGEIAAFIVEPIQGEGGIVVPPLGYLQGARELCTRYGVLLIFDEVQTGLGRTGTLFACNAENVAPDILTLAKALGGGLVPIGAVLCTEACYTAEFALKHTSTFAQNTLCCRVGLRSLELITRNEQELVRQVAENGRALREGLEAIQRKFPELIKAIRGRGYLLGMEFTTDFGAFGRQCLMSFMAEQESLALGLCSYLLNVEHIRMAPTLFGAKVMRIEPPLIATVAECRYFLDALERALTELRACNTPRLFGHLVGRDMPPADATAPRPQRTVARPSADAREGRWGFVAHPLDLESYVDIDSSLAAFSRSEREDLVDRLNNCQLNDLEDTLVIGATRFTSAARETAYGELLAVSHTAEELMNMPGEEAVEKVRKAVRLAHARGAQIVGLGGYTSIVTKNGLYLQDMGIPLTTGNSYTVVSALETVEEVARCRNRALAEMSLAVVGATGSIGRATAILLSEQAGRLLLVGNPKQPERSLERLRRVSEEIVGHLVYLYQQGRAFPDDSLADLLLRRGLLARCADADGQADCVQALQDAGRLRFTVDGDRTLPEIELIVTATSSTHGLLTAENLRPGAVVCDISRPSNVSQEVRAARPDVLALDAGIVELPGRQDLGIAYGLPDGCTYACMAETMIMGLERHYTHGTLGSDLDVRYILHIQRLARKHGFRLAGLQTSGRAVGKADWQRLARAAENGRTCD
ncbi:MAG TPA: aminotransferase class III-fold pyridoxal phosphate-dependent enzyme [Chthonomonadaceae bacterium]|nr:aminotransferase class III-fold pyridoxal phosphate-dependent enzyme [Chthonomonadaceae bacterium]